MSPLHARRIGLPLEVPMLGDGRDELRHAFIAASSLRASPDRPTVGQRRRHAAPPRAAACPAPSARIVLQWRYWSLTNSSAWPTCAERLRGRLAIGNDQRVEQHRGRRFRARPRRRCRRRCRRDRAERGPTKRGTAPSARQRRVQACSDARRRRHRRTRIATRRVRMLPSPGRANSDSAGDIFTSGRLLRRHARLPAPSAPRCRGPRPPAAASSASTFTSCDTMRSRIAGTCTLVSSKRNARAMCACSTGVWLS